MSKTNFEVDKDKLEVRITREFNATPERMWQAYTEADQVAQWWENTTIEKLDVKVGGEWRFVSAGDENAKEYAFKGVFKELDKPHKITRTFEFEGMPGHVMVETVTFDPHPDGKTKQSTVSKFANLDDLNGMVGMGMEHGAAAGLDRLAKVVEK